MLRKFGSNSTIDVDRGQGLRYIHRNRPCPVPLVEREGPFIFAGGIKSRLYLCIIMPPALFTMFEPWMFVVILFKLSRSR